MKRAGRFSFCWAESIRGLRLFVDRVKYRVAAKAGIMGGETRYYVLWWAAFYDETAHCAMEPPVTMRPRTAMRDGAEYYENIPQLCPPRPCCGLQHICRTVTRLRRGGKEFRASIPILARGLRWSAHGGLIAGVADGGVRGR